MAACATQPGNVNIDNTSVSPATQVTKKGVPLPLTGTTVEIGQQLSEATLVDMRTVKEIDLNDYFGSVLFLSIAPSIDARICEAQTHFLGEEGGEFPPTIKRITISQDTPFTQARFEKEAKLEDILYLSD